MGDDPGSLIIQQLIILFVLIALHAYLTASEMAIVSTDRSKLANLADDGDARAEKVTKLMKEPLRLIHTIHIAITFITFFNVSFASTVLAPYLYNFANHYFHFIFGKQISFILIVLLFSYIALVFGEFVPKRIALQNPERISLIAVKPVLFLFKLIKPFAFIFNKSTNLILRILGIDITRTEEQVTREEIRSIIEIGQEQGVINPFEREIIDSVISFDDKQAEDIMTARTEVFMIDIEDPLPEYISEMLNLKFSRIPVYEDNPDNIIGILYLKDFLLQVYKKGSFDDIKIRGILRPAYFVPERKNINDLFNDMQEARKHMALLIDEYGGFSGLVTLEDLLEEIVGDIDDEYDHDEPDIYKIDEHSYQVQGSISIKEFNSDTGAELDEDSDDYDTIGGFLINLLDYIPEDGERPVVEYENLIFHILKVEEKRIKDIRVEVLEHDYSY